MAKWEPSFPIDYSPRGDDVDTFAQKTKSELEMIYSLLNVLRQNSPTSGDLRNTEPFQFHVDISSGKILIRNSANTNWSVIGNVDEDFLGITAKDIDAIANDGTIGKLSAGRSEDMPTDAKTGDMFYNFEERRLYYYSGTGWEIFLSLNFADLYDYERYCVARAEVDYSGRDKIPRLDKSTGKGNFDISGSADKILGYTVETANLKDDDVLVFDNEKSKWVNKPKDSISRNEISNTGGADKIVQTDNNGFAQVSITGSAAAIDGVEVTTADISDKKVLGYNATYKRFEPADTIAVSITGSAEKLSGISLDTDNLMDGQFLVFDARNKKLVSDKREYLNEADVSNSGELNKIIRLGSDGIIHANLDGSASKIGGFEIDTSGMRDGQVLVYDAGNRKLKPANKDCVTDEMISETGEIGKLIRLGSDKTIHANVDGSVSKIDGVVFNLDKISAGDLLTFDGKTKSIVPAVKDTNATSINNITFATSTLKDGQVLAYDSKNKMFTPADKDVFTERDVSSTGEIGKLIRVAANTPLNVNITGSASMIDGVNVSASRPEDGDVLVYRKSRNSFRPEPKGAAGDGKTLTFTKGAVTVAEYNGSKELTLDIGEAEKFSTPRKIKLTGCATGEVYFDGSSDVELNVANVTTTLADEADYSKRAERLAKNRKFSIEGLVIAAEKDFDGTDNLILKVTDVKKLGTARKIEITGDASGDVLFDGSSDVSIALVVSYAKTTATAASALLSTKAEQDAKGNVIDTTYATKNELSDSKRVVVDKYLEDYAKSADVEKVYAKADDVEETYVKKINLEGMTSKLNAASADKISSARKISLTGAVKGNVTFDGSKDVEMNVE